MDTTVLIINYFISLALIFMNALFVVLRKYSVLKWFKYPALISSGASIVLTFLVAGHLPIYNKFTSLQEVVFILIVLTSIYTNTNKVKVQNINTMWFFILFVQLYVITQQMEPNNNYYMYDNLFVVLFFQFRLISMAMFIFALGNYIGAFKKHLHQDRRADILHRARNYTLLGAVVYLAGEFSGSFWLYLWYGDSWHWSKGFFLASIMFLLSMISGHLPPRYLSGWKIKTILSSSPLMLITLIYLIAH
ncbi:MAG: hypothetical protein C0594_01075 [Marinilabiliales bacterium]|nr:MAG: hypothetical protein C0594_01075 [Marinilabiliales bacterium]